MNCRDYYRNSEALYTMELIIFQLDNITFKSVRAETSMEFDLGNYIFSIEFTGYKHNMNSFFVTTYITFMNIVVNCDINKRKVIL